jgi:hypothetical protein
MAFKLRHVAAAAVLLAPIGVVRSQNKPADPLLPPPLAPPAVTPIAVTPPARALPPADPTSPNPAYQPPAGPASTPGAPSVDELLDQLEAIRRQKAELQRKEDALVNAVKARLAGQAQRLHSLRLDVAESKTPPAVPPPPNDK